MYTVFFDNTPSSVGLTVAAEERRFLIERLDAVNADILRAINTDRPYEGLAQIRTAYEDRLWALDEEAIAYFGGETWLHAIGQRPDPA